MQRASYKLSKIFIALNSVSMRNYKVVKKRKVNNVDN